ncbi:MAG: class I SAM-dependent methyltransferase [Jatrophihabitans sp.]
MTDVPDEMFRNRVRAESFGAVAAQYDRARPSYPDSLVLDLLMADPRDVLDVGCGTGKAGRLFAERGIRVLGVEVDPAMAAVARSHGLEVEVSDFEAWDDRRRRFDLLISGQAWHWIDPSRGAAKARRVLRRDATVALFWNMDDVLDEDNEALDTVYAREAPLLLEYRRTHRGRRRGRAQTVDALEAHGFRDVSERDYSWQRTYTCDEWLDLLPTYSDHHLLPDDQRARLLAGIGTVIDERGGTITVRYATQTITGRCPG